MEKPAGMALVKVIPNDAVLMFDSAGWRVSFGEQRARGNVAVVTLGHIQLSLPKALRVNSPGSFLDKSVS